MAAVDTNILVRLLTQDDPVQTRKAEAYLLAQAPLWVPLSVLVETVHVLSRLYGWSKPVLVAVLQGMTHSRHLNLQDQPAVAAATALWSTAKAGFVDCLKVELAKFHGKEPLATFDKEAAKLPGAMRL